MRCHPRGELALVCDWRVQCGWAEEIAGAELVSPLCRGPHRLVWFLWGHACRPGCCGPWPVQSEEGGLCVVRRWRAIGG